MDKISNSMAETAAVQKGRNKNMDLTLDARLAEGYRSGSQSARVLTEDWIARHMFCPRCGSDRLSHFENNRPVADFYCPVCGNQFELKSKNGIIGKKVPDGAYDTMISRIRSDSSPDFLFMGYSLSRMTVNNLTVVPKYFLHPDIIEKREPLSDSARRSGWIGCNILLDKIPIQGKIDVITDGIVSDKAAVLNKTARSGKLETKNLSSRGWLFDILRCVNAVSNSIFNLEQIYSFEETLRHNHPDNRNIRPKIRQQLQILRDKGFIEFVGNGIYRKIL